MILERERVKPERERERVRNAETGQRERVRAGGVAGLLAFTDHSLVANSISFCDYDGNGNLTGFVSASDGTVTAQYEYGPFGELIRCSGLVAKISPFRFSTKYHDNETDLLYYGYRYLNTFTGRWPNRDPIEEYGGINLYMYCSNNSISWFDPLGWDVWIEGRSANEPAGHQSLAVGDPNGEYFQISFGGTGLWWTGTVGTVYEDVGKGGVIDPDRYYKTSPEVDALIKGKLQALLEQESRKRYPYRLLNANCRTWSQKQFDLIAKELEKHTKGKKATPPKRKLGFPTSIGASSGSTSNPTTTTSSTTEQKVAPY